MVQLDKLLPPPWSNRQPKYEINCPPVSSVTVINRFDIRTVAKVRVDLSVVTAHPASWKMKKLLLYLHLYYRFESLSCMSVCDKDDDERNGGNPATDERGTSTTPMRFDKIS
jgi:hypothetical protein